MSKLFAPFILCLCLVGVSAAQIPDLSDKSKQTPEQTAQQKERDATFARIDAGMAQVNADKANNTELEKELDLRDAQQRGDADGVKKAERELEHAQKHVDYTVNDLSTKEGVANSAERAADKARRQANDAARPPK